MRGRCQICGRLKPIRITGGIAYHHVQGVPCTGKGQLPLDQDDAFLVSEAKRLRDEQRQHSATIRTLIERRANFIDPAIEKARDAAWSAADKLERRLKRHRNWPARYEREMARDGMSMPPPAYLLARAAAAPLPPTWSLAA
jgi:hypothetical protein